MKSAVRKIKDDLSNLNSVLLSYDTKMKEFSENLRIDMKTYAQANSEQAGLMSYYSQLKDELDVIHDDMEIRLCVAKSNAMKKIERVANNKYTEKQLSMHIEADPDVRDTRRACGEVKERLEKAKSMVAGFMQRGYSLNNLTRIRAGEFQDDLIYVGE